MFIFIMQIELN